MKFVMGIMVLWYSAQSLAQRDTLIYVGDPMCSWCYGFSPELDKIKEAFPNTPMEMVMGGLRAGGEENMNDLKAFLSQHWKEVEVASGQKFNYSILNDSYLMYDTEPACRAVMVATYLKPEISYSFFKRVQYSFYYENKNPLDFETYVAIAEEFGINAGLFRKTIKSHEAKAATQSSFDYSKQLGVQGFPTLLAKIDGKIFLVTNGYQKAEKLIGLLKMKGLN